MKYNEELKDTNLKDSDTCSDSLNHIDIIVDDSDQNNDHEVNNVRDNVHLYDMNEEVNDVLDNIEGNSEGNVVHHENVNFQVLEM